jgi:hypothetical protein
MILFSLQQGASQAWMAARAGVLRHTLSLEFEGNTPIILTSSTCMALTQSILAVFRGVGAIAL